MATAKKTGKQKALLVLSILTIIFAAFCLLIAFGCFLCAADAMNSTDASYFTYIFSNGKAENITGNSPKYENALVAVLWMIAAIITGLEAIGSFIIGILGIRGAHNASKIDAFVVHTIIGLIISIILFAIDLFIVYAWLPDPASNPYSSLGALTSYINSGAGNVDRLTYMCFSLLYLIISFIFFIIYIILGVRINKEGNKSKTQPKVEAQTQVILKEQVLPKVQTQMVPKEQALSEVQTKQLPSLQMSSEKSATKQEEQ